MLRVELDAQLLRVRTLIALARLAAVPVIAVALLASAVGSADRGWGTLRHLYVQPVNRPRLLAGKLGAVLVITAIATGCVIAAGLLTGLALFGWHAFHIIGAPSLSVPAAITRSLVAGGYTLLCMLSIGTIALALGLLRPHGAEALGARKVAELLRLT